MMKHPDRAMLWIKTKCWFESKLWETITQRHNDRLAFCRQHFPCEPRSACSYLIMPIRYLIMPIRPKAQWQICQLSSSMALHHFRNCNLPRCSQLLRIFCSQQKIGLLMASLFIASYTIVQSYYFSSVALGSYIQFKYNHFASNSIFAWYLENKMYISCTIESFWPQTF